MPRLQYLELPVYQHKDRILDALSSNQVAVVESPTGSGKTTQLPAILYDSGYAASGVIGMTQPRRIAALSVSEFIARQMGTEIPGIVGYKMRFEDKTNPSTRIKIMTDGILLQEMKLDPYLSRYSCLIVDEAHERSLNIDFILGLLKRVLEVRRDFKALISSATINAEAFSQYFGGCPVVKIDAQSYPVTLIYDPPVVERPRENGGGSSKKGKPTEPPQGASPSNLAEEALLLKIEGIAERFISEKREGDMLIFLPGEKSIKTCLSRLAMGPLGKYLHLIPLYGRLGKEEQERVFEEAPPGKTKAVIATNIAETSITIDGITAVIDSGLAKLNYYNPRTFTSSLVEGPISRASGNQRKGRAGRTAEGVCYRLYHRKDFETRQEYTVEEIFRTDLSEVVLRMADLGITAFEEFDFIAPPGREGILAAVETLNLLGALEKDLTLSPVGKMMTQFPLLPRQSRIIVDAIMRYPDVVGQTIIAAAFLSTQSPYILPPGEEIEARRAHHKFRDPRGDFVSYLKLFASYEESPRKDRFCDEHYLDPRAMAEIEQVTSQLEEIVSGMGFPLLSSGSIDDYLCAVAAGLIQFVCVREGRDLYRTLTADRILIHPGSAMFKTSPQYIVAGEIIRTTRMYASSVSPLTEEALEKISPELFADFGGRRPPKSPGKLKPSKDSAEPVRIGGELFETRVVKGKKVLILPWEKARLVRDALEREKNSAKGLRGTITFPGGYTLFGEEKLSLILALLPHLDIDGALTREWPRKRRFTLPKDLAELRKYMPLLLNPGALKGKGGKNKKNDEAGAKKALGFISLLTNGEGSYWFQVSRNFHVSLNESLGSLEMLIDELGDDPDEELKSVVSQAFRRLAAFLS